MSRAPKFLLIFAALVASAAPLDLSDWKYRKKIPLTPGDGLAIVKLDREIYAAIGNRFGSLRVVRDGEELPYVFDTPSEHELPFVGVIKMFNRSLVPGVGIQFSLRTETWSKHNRVRLGTDLKNFRKNVRIETSHDGRNWSIVRNDGAIFNFSQDGHEFSSTTVEYPVSTQPFLRITIFGWNNISAIKAASLDYEYVRPAAFETLATLNPQVSEDAATKSTIVVLDLGLSGLSARRITLKTSSPQFHRAVGVEESDNGKDWSYLTQDTIARLPGSGFTQESLVLATWGDHRYYRLRIYNRDDKPIQIGPVQVEGLVHQIKFLAATRGSYWLYYASPDERMPEYDLSMVLARQSISEHLWTLDKAEENPSYRPPGAPRKPWSERHPVILYTALGCAVVALGVATFRFASRLRPSS
jgi:hypothetical protein